MTPGPPITARRRRFASLRAIGALMLREMATTYGRSPGGYLWAVAEPVAGIAVLTAIFSLGFQAPALGRNFPIFYATGLIPFLLFSTVSAKVGTALVFSRALLAYPAVTFADALIARFLVNLAAQLMVAYLVLGGILLLFDTRTIPDPVAIGQALALAAVLALGIGTLNAFLFTRFAAWQTVWSILMRPLFLVSGIFFLPGSIPQPMRDWLWFNPLVHAVGVMRRGFYPGYRADYAAPLYVLAVSLIALAAGLILLRRSHRDLLQD